MQTQRINLFLMVPYSGERMLNTQHLVHESCLAGSHRVPAWKRRFQELFRLKRRLVLGCKTLEHSIVCPVQYVRKSHKSTHHVTIIGHLSCFITSNQLSV